MKRILAALLLAGVPAYAADNNVVCYEIGWNVGVNAQMISGGNPCVVGMSAGISVTGFGLSGGSMYQDKECELRQQAALLANMGLRSEAVAILCQNDAKMQKALSTTGRCRVASQAAPAPVATADNGQCYVKPGTTRTVVTNWSDRLACARSLGLR